MDYGFIGTLDAKTRHQRAEEVGYGIRDVWVDPTEAVEEVAPTTLEGVNARVTELASVQEQDTWDIYDVIEDTQDRQTLLFQRVDGLVKDRHFHYETAQLLDQEALVSREAWAHSVGLSSAVHYKLQAYKNHTQMQDFYSVPPQIRLDSDIIQMIARNNMPPRRSSVTARAAATATPMTATAVTEGVVVLSQWFEKMESVIHISNCAMENQVCYLHFPWKCSDMVELPHEDYYSRCCLCYGTWKTLKEDDDNRSNYTQRFQEQTLDVVEGMFPTWNQMKLRNMLGELPIRYGEDEMSNQPRKDDGESN
ncbi:hypothetical protein Tco_0067355 [Tanacetum coccineum]